MKTDYLSALKRSNEFWPNSKGPTLVTRGCVQVARECGQVARGCVQVARGMVW